MDLTIPEADLALKRKAKEFAQTWLFPQEEELELNGHLPPETLARLRRAVVEHGLNGINHSREHGGQGLTIFQQMLVSEELGKATGALWAVVWHPAYPLRFGTEAQKREYLVPSCEGQRRGAFAITEPGAGSDPRLVQTRADRRNGKYSLSGEKWFVTTGDYADYLIVHAHVDGDPGKPTLFLVDKDLPGVRIKRIPKFMHTYVFEHPEFVFEQVELGEDKVLGKVGEGFELTKDWFVEARLQIAANCLGAAIRAAEIANRYAAERVQFGRPIRDFQAIEFMLADMAVEIMATKSLVYRVAWEIDRGGDRKLVHARASAIKLQASEMAGRVIDKALQILGGRGYMRENPVERLYRDIRVDRIWEGTSEIQRAIIGGQIKKRGLAPYVDWV
ncbi:MAG TPA: acyl-CoA dehydrogenase family protein [Stellaceae bacterium]|jgi:acyl-CoA dehydrogenase|nr:acyl-CoA dehydrogenase family protein [Stellaceae bacterium]